MTPNRLPKSKKKQRWVVKAGSNLVCSGGPLLIKAWMQQVAELKRRGIEVVWVTSGAIASGVERTDFGKRKRTLSEKQALSAIGQPLLMDLYNQALQSSGLLGAQILLTYDDMLDTKRKHSLQGTLETLLKWKATPVLNENDATSTEEIHFGDNDSLSAKVACMLAADRLVILTDVEGLYESDPRKNSRAKLIGRVRRVTPAVLALAGAGAGTHRGTGGMKSKLLAAELTGQSGIETWLVKGDLPSVLTRISNDEAIGTRIEGAGK